jgi:DNA-binding MurR/RpiR family transcriptional regulator
MATYLTHGLYGIGVDAVAVLSGGIPLATALARLDEQCVLVSLGVWRYVKSVANAVILAKERGACCIAITDSPVSPLTKHADHAFIAPTEGIAHTLSMAGTFALLNTILVVVSHKHPERTVQALRDIDKAYRFGDLLLAH